MVENQFPIQQHLALPSRGFKKFQPSLKSTEEYIKYVFILNLNAVNNTKRTFIKKRNKLAILGLFKYFYHLGNNAFNQFALMATNARSLRCVLAKRQQSPLMSNVRSVKLVPEILVSEGIVIISSISFFTFLFILIKRIKISQDGTKNFATVIFRFLAMIKISAQLVGSCKQQFQEK